MAAVEFGGRAAYLPGAETLVVADLHVGRDATANVALPLGERADLVERLTDALGRFDPARVVVAGDLLHSFGSIPDGVPRTVAEVAAAVADAGAALVVVPGNHDGMLDAVREATPADAPGFETTPAAALAGGTVVCHGHEPPEADADRYVVGHEHPAITIEGQKRPCFLHGEGLYRGADVLVLPAFSRLARGTTVNGLRTADCLSPLVADLDACRPVVTTDGEALTFPRLGELREHL